MSILILGLAAFPRDRVWLNVELLVRSARRNSPSTAVALLTAPLGDNDRRRLEEFSVDVVECVDPPPPHDKSQQAREARQRWMLELFGTRHALYRKFLSTHAFGHVLLTDTRDVIITGDLAPRVAENRLVLSQEDANSNLASEELNRRWIYDGYGDVGLAMLGAKPILCAGTVFGPQQLIDRYLAAMTQEVQRLGVETTRRIGDQPLHNHLAYTGSLPEFIVSPAEDGWIRSIGVQRFDAVRFDWDPARSTPRDGPPCAVIHQYDRHLSTAAMRYAVARSAGLPLAHRWRLESYRDNGKDVGARILRRLQFSTATLVRPVRPRDST